MLSKETFIDTINCIENMERYHDALYSLNKKHGVDGWVFGLDGVDAIMTVLVEVMNDRDSWISYYCFELDFGKKYKPGMIKDKNGNDIVLDTADCLYDLLSNGGDSN